MTPVPDSVASSDAVPLLQRRCRPLLPGDRLEGDALREALAAVPRWQVDAGTLVRRWRFADFHRTMAFVNAVAWVAHDQDHHPELQVSHGHCQVRLWTHSAGGITENDLICAARIDALLE